MSAHHSELRVASPSQSTIDKSQAQSIRSSRSQKAGPSTLKSIVTAPPWARDEPPSPTEQQIPLPESALSVHPRPSQSRTTSSHADSSLHPTSTPYSQQEGPLWWMFTRRGREEGGPPRRLSTMRPNWPTLSPRAEKTERSEKDERPTKQRTRSMWLGGAQRRLTVEPAEGDPDPVDDERGNRRGLHLPMPTPTPFITIAHNKTPGWDIPWSPRSPQHADSDNGQVSDWNPGGSDEQDGNDTRKRSKWYHRRKKLRSFILNNHYVPLLFRVINITFTSAALGVAINIRHTEMKFGVEGAVGSSPTIVIIFAPLTLVHVMFAIYLEYFGRPLGLWRTSMKLLHTLSETLFICAWSAALSLCFDNFFTSLIQCASPSSISWYNNLPRIVPSVPNLGHGEGEPGDYICDHQLALICLVFLGLVMYCINLFISLFRIFEKIKFRPETLPR